MRTPVAARQIKGEEELRKFVRERNVSCDFAVLKSMDLALVGNDEAHISSIYFLFSLLTFLCPHTIICSNPNKISWR